MTPRRFRRHHRSPDGRRPVLDGGKPAMPRGQSNYQPGDFQPDGPTYEFTGASDVGLPDGAVFGPPPAAPDVTS